MEERERGRLQAARPVRRSAFQASMKTMLVLVICSALIIWSARAVWQQRGDHREIWNLRYGTPSQRRDAVEELSKKWLQTDEGAAALVGALDDTDTMVRARAAKALAACPLQSATVVPALVRTLHDRDASVRAAANTTLGKLKLAPEVCMPGLLAALGDSAGEVRAAAAGAIGNFPGPVSQAVEQRLEALLDDSDPNTGEAALGALRAVIVHPTARERLLMLVPSESPREGLLRTALASRTDGVRAQAATALGEDFPRLAEPPEPAFEQVLARVLTALEKARSDRSPLVQCSAIRALCAVERRLDNASMERHRTLTQQFAPAVVPLEKTLLRAREPKNRGMIRCGVKAAQPFRPGFTWLLRRFGWRLWRYPPRLWMWQLRPVFDFVDPELRMLQAGETRILASLRDAHERLAQALNNSDPAVRAVAANALPQFFFFRRGIEVPATVLADLRKALTGGDEVAAAAALSFLEQAAFTADHKAPGMSTEIEQTAHALELIMREGLAPRKLRAARALAHLGRGAEVAVPVLGEVLTRGSRDHRPEVIMALAPLSTQADADHPIVCKDFADLVPRLVELAHDSDDQVGRDAVYLLRTLGPRIEPAAVALEKLRKEEGFKQRQIVELVFPRLPSPATKAGGLP